jgi:hypothetical protein
MFGWRDLSIGKRVGAVFLLLLFLVCGPPLIIFASSSGEMVQTAGAVLVCLGVLLNPQSFSQPSDALIDIDKAPKTCRALYGVGIFAFCGGWVLSHFGI